MAKKSKKKDEKHTKGRELSAPSKREKKAEARIEKLAERLAKAEAKAEKWKAEAKRLRAEAKAADAIVAEAPKPAEESAPEPVTAPEPRNRPATPKPAPTVTSDDTAPDASWTVAALKAEARRRGFAGYSRKSKTELLALLDG